MPQPFGQTDPVKAYESHDAMITPPALLPEPTLEHPQQHPNKSTPPEKAKAGDTSEEDCNDDMGEMPPMASDEDMSMPAMDVFHGDAWKDVNGGITGGAKAQSWGTGWKNTQDVMPVPPAVNDALFKDQMPASVSLDAIQADNAGMWGDQWKQRPLGPDQK